MDEDFKARITDALRLCLKTDKIKEIGFLREEELSVAVELAKKHNAKFVTYGGYDASVRQYIFILPEFINTLDYSEYITSLTASFPKQYKLTHRDFLGAVLSLGIKRETVGDILIEEGRAVIFLAKSVSDFVKDNLNKVGNVGVALSFGYDEPLPEMSDRVKSRVTVSSNRIDSVISAIINVSRSKSQELINDGIVFVDSVVVKKNTLSVFDKNRIIIRGYGTYFVDEIGDITKKGKTVLIFSRYK